MSWYAIYTRSQAEQSVASFLAARFIEHYLPVFRVKRQWHDRLTVVDVPVFPGYVFARFDREHRLNVLTIPGVVRILGHAGELEPIPVVEIESVRAMMALGDRVTATATTSPSLSKGALVRVVYGPLRGAEGRCQRVKKGWRIVVAIESLGQSISADVDLADVEVVEGARAEICGDSRRLKSSSALTTPNVDVSTIDGQAVA